MDPRREDRRATDRSRRPSRSYSRCCRPGRHAGRRRHALPHRRSQSELRAQDAPRRQAQGRQSGRHREDAQRNDGQRAEHVRHRLQVRRPRLHHRVRRRDPAARRTPRSRRVRRHAVHRQGLLRAHGQQPLRDGVDSSQRARAAAVVHRVAPGGGQGLHTENRQPGRGRGVEAAAERQRARVG
jgi:hypothetical protein